MTKHAKWLIPFLAVLGACTSAPTGPTVAVMPTAGKPFEVFQQEDMICRQFADGSIQGTSNAALKEGLLGGAGVGAINASGKQNQSQSQYNIAYMQCMYAKGNQVPFSR